MAQPRDIFEVMYTMRAVRKFKPDPVPDDVLRKVLEAAGQAPSGGNRQPWRFVVIRSPEAKRKISELAVEAVHRATNGPGGAQAGSAPPSTEFQESLAAVPVIIIVCAQQPAAAGPWSVGPFGQVFPAVENLLLAARAYGLGGTITTGYRWMEDELKAYLGLPEELDTATLIPLGYPDESRGERHGKKSRRPIEELACENHWGQPITF